MAAFDVVTKMVNTPNKHVVTMDDTNDFPLIVNPLIEVRPRPHLIFTQPASAERARAEPDFYDRERHLSLDQIEPIRRAVSFDGLVGRGLRFFLPRLAREVGIQPLRDLHFEGGNCLE
ncbi:hypothetical protein CR983_03230 [Candidatus Saccharibacteria bacterium]|nr:MAG: hypothetical protein CR983_03230 [Candidatus Saccharibacteria bacterium]